MDRTQLLDALRPGGGDVVLRADLPAIQHISAGLSEIVNRQGQLVIRSPQFPSSTETAAPTDDTIVVTGRSTVLKVAVDVKLVVTLADGVVDQMHLLVRPPDGWRMAHSFTDLAEYAGGNELFDGLRLTNPLLVVAGRAQAITDLEFGLNAELFDPGLTLYAPGLSEPLPLGSFLTRSLPAAVSSAGRSPQSVRVVIDRTGTDPSFGVLCWWDTAGVGLTLGSAAVLRVAVGLACAKTSAPTGAGGSDPGVAWWWDVQLHEDEQPVLVSSTRPATAGGQPMYTAVFESARYLEGGAGMLGSLAGGTDPGKLVPLGKRAQLSLASLSYQPEVSVGAQFVVTDSATGGPFSWEAIPKALTLDNVRLWLVAPLGSAGTPQVGVIGIAEIGGFSFEVEVDPGHLVRGELLEPHDLDLESFMASLLGHTLDFPNLQLELLAARYTNDLDGKVVTYAVTVGGHIDVLGNGGLLLESVGFEIESTDGVATRRHLTGSMKLGSVSVATSADYRAGDGWMFEGRADIDAEAPLGELLDDLVHRVGLSIPVQLPTMTLNEFGIKVGGKARLFSGWGRATWHPEPDHDVPWFRDPVETVVDIGSSLDPQTLTRRAEVSVSWLHTAGERTFLAQASHTHAGNEFSVSWSGGDPDDTLGLAEVHRALGLEALFAMPDGAGWSVFEFSSLLASYRSNPRLVQLQTTSRLGPGTLTFDGLLAADRRLLSATWAADADGGSVGIDALLGALGWTSTIGLLGSMKTTVFDLTELSLRYVDGPESSVQISGRSQDAFYDDVFLASLPSAGSTRGFVAGVGFRPGTDFAQIPGIGKIPFLAEALAFMLIEPISLIYSTAASTKFVPPVGGVGTGAAPATAAGRRDLVGYRLAEGVTFATRIVFARSTSRVLANLATIIGLDALDARITIGDGFDVLALLPGTIDLPTGAGGSLQLSNASFGLGITSAGPRFQIGGSATFSLFGTVRHVDAFLRVTELSADASLHLTDVEIPPLHALPGVQFKNDFWVEIGAEFAPPGIDIGFIGEFYIGDDKEQNTGKVAIVMEIVEGVVNPEYVRFSISKLTVWSMFEAMTNMMGRLDDAAAIVDALDDGSELAADTGHALEFLKQQYKNLQPVFDDVSLNDVEFHWSEKMVVLPDGSVAMPGVGFRGELSLFGWDMYAAFEFSVCSPTKLTAHLEMEPIDLLGVVVITGDGAGVVRPTPVGAAPATAGTPPVVIAGSPDYLVRPGGPVLIVSSEHAPFLHASLHVGLFGLLHFDVLATIDETGFAFRLDTGVGDVVGLSLGCTLSTSDPFRFEAYGSFSLHLRTDLSFELPIIGEIPIVLDAGLDASIHLVIEDGSFELSIDGSFEFQGVELTMPTLTIPVPIPSFGDLPAQIIRHIKDLAADIFGELFNVIGDVAAAVGEFIGDAAGALADGVEAIGHEVAEDVKAVGAAVEQGFRATEEALGAAADLLASGAEAAYARVDAAIDEVTAAAAQVVDEWGREATQTLADAGHAVTVVTEAVAADVAEVGEAIIDLGNLAVHEAEQIVAAIGPIVGDILQTADRVADAVVDAAETVAHGIEDAAEVLWDAAQDLAQAFEDAAEWVGDAASDFADFLGF